MHLVAAALAARSGMAQCPAYGRQAAEVQPAGPMASGVAAGLAGARSTVGLEAVGLVEEERVAGCDQPPKP